MRNNVENVVITGATSFIGVNLIKALLTENYQIYAVIRPNSQKSGLLPISKKIHLIEAEMVDYSKLDQFIPKPCDVFVHLAWNGTRGASRMNMAMQEQNYQCSIKALNAALRLGCSMAISAGSQAEYGLCNNAISEDTPCHPNTEYGKWKLKFYEDAFKLCQANNVHFKEPRIFSVYGPGDFDGTLVISTLRKMLNNQDCKLTKCKQMWDFIFIDDVIKGIIKLIDTDCSDGIYNFASGTARPLKSFIEEMYHITHSKSKLLYGAIPYPETGLINILPLVDKLQNETGWHAQVTFEQGISRILNVLRCGEE